MQLGDALGVLRVLDYDEKVVPVRGHHNLVLLQEKQHVVRIF